MKQGERNITTPQKEEDEGSNWLLAVAQKQDRAAFIQLFNYFAPRVKAYLRRQGLEAGTAEDITQDVMLQVWKRAGQFDAGKARASTWIFTIARNRLIDVWRQKKAERLEISTEEDIPEPSYVPHDELETAQENTILREAVAELPDAQREIIEQSYYAEQTHRMIAKARKIPLGTVKSRLRLALEHLRNRIKDEDLP